MNLRLKKKLAEQFLYRSYVQFLQFVVIDHFCNKQFNSIDVGCHTGLYTFAMAKKSKKVFAFDPLADIQNSLKIKKTVDNILNYLVWPDPRLRQNIEYFPNALGDIEETKEFNIYTKRSRSSFYNEPGLTVDRKVNLKIKKLDDFNLDDVNFVKINAEGYDLKVICGASKLIETQKPIIMFEFISSYDYDLEILSDFDYAYKKIIPKFDNLEFVIFYPKNVEILELEKKIHQYNLFWVENGEKLINQEISKNKFKLDLINYFQNSF